MSSKIIGAVEIGTSKITVLVGELVHQRGLNIIGIGTTSSRGVMKGEIVDFNSAKGSVHAAILAAEKNAGATIDGVYLAQTGAHLTGFFNSATVTVGTNGGYVVEEDIQRVMDSAKSRRLPENRVFVHYLR
jgi:cell division protein FtsA